MEGWISLHRRILNWEWYSDANTFRVFIHLLLLANHDEKKWKGQVVKRGQLITSLDHLAEDLKLTKQQIRTSINKLKSTHEITTETTNKFTTITIEKYSDYQDIQKENNTQNNTQDNIEITFKQHSNNIQITPNNNDNNYNNNLFSLFNNKENDFVGFKEGDEVSQWLKTKNINSVEEFKKLDSSEQDNLIEEWFLKTR